MTPRKRTNLRTGAIMRLILTVAVLCCTAVGAASAQDIVPPEVVRFENVRVDGEMKIVTVGNAKNHYSLFCNVKADGCITPERNKNYLLFNKDTRWKMPGAKDLYHWLGYRIGLLNITKAKTSPLFPNKAAVQKSLACFFSTGQAAVTSRTRFSLMGRSSTWPAPGLDDTRLS